MIKQERVSRDEAIDLLANAPLLALMNRANVIRTKLHPDRKVTFVVDTNPNYTNVCITDCTFCSFYRKPGAADSYLLEPPEIGLRAASAYAMGATTILLQGGHSPDVKWPYIEALIIAIQNSAPGIHIHPLSPSEIDHIAKNSGMSIRDVLKGLWNLGIRTIPGGGAEILVDQVRRKLAVKKLRSGEWLECMRIAHEIGFRTTATMTFGHIETVEDIVDHLIALRDLQDETGGFYSFIPWSFKPGKSPLAKKVPTARLSSFYLRVIAVSRIVLDNFPHIQASWFGDGMRAGQLALNGGADDFGGVLLEENVLREASHAVASSTEAVVRMIRDAGFVPVQRNTLYDHLHTYDAECSISPEHMELTRIRRSYIPLIESKI